MTLKEILGPLLVALAAAVAPAAGWASDITLRLASLPSGNHKYYHRLLEESLKATGNSVKIVTEDNLPQPRIFSYLDEGKLTLHWMLQTRERDKRFVAVDHKLTQGLAGQRVLLIPKGDETVYARVKTLDDLKATGKVAGLGLGWFDVSVWNESTLTVREQGGDWKLLYSMIASKQRGIDYFPRGAIEILGEAKDQPNLAVEPNLLLVYPRDFVFYLSTENASLKPLIETSLKQAEKSGLQKRLMEEYFGPSIASLNMDRRTKIHLKNPAAN